MGQEKRGQGSRRESEAAVGMGRREKFPPRQLLELTSLWRQNRDKEISKREESAVIHSQRNWVNVRNLFCK